MFGGIRSLGLIPVLLIGAGSLAQEDHSQGWRSRHPKDAPLVRALDGDLCSARECPARGGRPGQFSRARSPWVRCCGNCLAAGAGVLTWVAAPRPEGSRPSGRGMRPAPESARCPRDLARLGQTSPV